MVFASWDRSASFSQMGAPESVRPCRRWWRWFGLPAGIGSAAAVSRRVREMLERLGADREALESGQGDDAAMESAVISAHRNPASSRAIAAATTRADVLAGGELAES